MGIYVNIAEDMLVNNAANQLSNDDLFNLIKSLDDKIAEYDFTLRLAKHFIKIIKKELVHEPTLDLLTELGLNK